MKSKGNALTSKEDLPPPKLIKINENERINKEFRNLIKEQTDSIEEGKEESFYLRSALIELRRLIKNKKITIKDRVGDLINIMERRLRELSELSAKTKDIDTDKILDE